MKSLPSKMCMYNINGNFVILKYFWTWGNPSNSTLCWITEYEYKMWVRNYPDNLTSLKFDLNSVFGICLFQFSSFCLFDLLPCWLWRFVFSNLKKWVADRFWYVCSVKSCWRSWLETILFQEIKFLTLNLRSSVAADKRRLGDNPVPLSFSCSLIC